MGGEISEAAAPSAYCFSGEAPAVLESVYRRLGDQQLNQPGSVPLRPAQG